MGKVVKTYYSCVVKFGKSKNYVAFVDDFPQVIGIGATLDDASHSLAISLKGAVRAKSILNSRKAAIILDEPFVFKFQNQKVESVIRAVEV